jgi:glycosyltransferase involved in cell wall biosynthesis
MSDQTFVSVVTPFHNTADFLAECIESVLSQTHERFEYVLVDNASTDGSGEIAERYAAVDDRIRVVRTPGLIPQVENYNFALQQISPDSAWCKVCQADDLLLPRCLTEMVTAGDASRDVVLVSSYSWRGDQLMGIGLPRDVEMLPGRQAARLHLLDDLFLFGSPTTVMYRADRVRDRKDFYDTGRLHEDTERCFELLQEGDFAFVHQILSFARVDPGSISGKASDLLSRELDRVLFVWKYAPELLDGDELERCRERTLREYYRRLAQRVARGAVSRTNAGLVDYQRRGLATVGLDFSWRRLAAGLGTVAVETVTSPRESINAARRRSQPTLALLALEDR